MVDGAWTRIETWLAANELLLPPATADAIAHAEAAMGQAFPDEMRASLAIHDGQRRDGSEIFGTWGLLSLERMVEVWRAKRALGLPAEWWAASWIPVANNGSGGYLCLVCEQGGQIIAFLHDDEARDMVAPSLTAWLAQVATQLERDEFEVVGRGRRLAPRGRDN